MRRPLHVRGRDLGDLRHQVDDLGELTGEVVQLGCGELQAGQPGEVLGFCATDRGHGWHSCRTRSVTVRSYGAPPHHRRRAFPRVNAPAYTRVLGRHDDKPGGMTTRLERQPSARTPPDGPDRDRFVDVLRVFAIGLVVLQHWLMPVLSYDDGRLITDNAFSGPGGWAVTWISQVMPLVFFAGGAASAMSLDGRRRRSLSTGRLPDNVEWVSGRIRRLAMPVIPLMAVWLPLPYLLGVLSVPQAPVHLAAGLVGQLLWFLALYVIITAASPWFLRLRDRCRGAEVVVMVVAAIGVDVTRFSVLDGIGDSAATALGYVNLVLVWGAIHQIGIHYASGSLRSLHGARAWRAEERRVGRGAAARCGR